MEQGWSSSMQNCDTPWADKFSSERNGARMWKGVHKYEHKVHCSIFSGQRRGHLLLCQWCIQAYSTESTRSSNYSMDLLTKGIFHFHLKDGARWRWFLLVTIMVLTMRMRRFGRTSNKAQTLIFCSPMAPEISKLAKLPVELFTWDEFHNKDLRVFTWNPPSSMFDVYLMDDAFLLWSLSFGMICKAISLSWYLLEFHTHSKHMQHMHMFVLFDHKHSLTYLQFTKL